MRDVPEAGARGGGLVSQQPFDQDRRVQRGREAFEAVVIVFIRIALGLLIAFAVYGSGVMFGWWEEPK